MESEPRPIIELLLRIGRRPQANCLAEGSWPGAGGSDALGLGYGAKNVSLLFPACLSTHWTPIPNWLLLPGGVPNQEQFNANSHLHMSFLNTKRKLFSHI